MWGVARSTMAKYCINDKHGFLEFKNLKNQKNLEKAIMEKNAWFFK